MNIMSKLSNVRYAKTWPGYREKGALNRKAKMHDPSKLLQG